MKRTLAPEVARRLPPNQALAAPGKWPLVGERAPAASDAPWTVTISGLVAHPRVYSLTELQAMPQESRVIDLHCVTRWSQLDVPLAGVPLAQLLEPCAPLPAAQFVSFVARSDRRHSTSLPLADVRAHAPLVALTWDGAPMPSEHGGPIRVIVPGRYLYKSLKWLAAIEVLAEDHLGYWEGEAGYHNHADPWLEERYLACNLDRREVQRLLAARDFAGRDLRSLTAAGHDLRGLRAAGAKLRDADLRRADLRDADLSGANLSNAHLEGADLRGASLAGADIEGADLRGADLRGADLRGASLFGVTFAREPNMPEVGDPGCARFDDTTLTSPESLGTLTPHQRQAIGR